MNDDHQPFQDLGQNDPDQTVTHPCTAEAVELGLSRLLPGSGPEHQYEMKLLQHVCPFPKDMKTPVPQGAFQCSTRGRKEKNLSCWGYGSYYKTIPLQAQG
ncbi:hypothetical protein Y1Q_0002063 [Alligator mississippiensis]|uniref:Uncharacterized protein n=1 Tax=Alligator mississippiensis TaxID=8496 RepID=A0A151MIS6_ALLMI|nr:hypothetical protein Y1Q_0002063 [Alligator mississippiensis]